MRVEPCCQSLLARILPAVDEKKEGTCIDVGVGTFAFYCELFARLGFKTVAVEPLPVKKLRQICQRDNITLIEGCLSDINGNQNLHLGTFAGFGNRNFSSLSPDWFGSLQEVRQVQSMRLLNLLSMVQARTVTCLKLDIEGWESAVIRQFPELPSTLMPKIVMFEYGGGVSRQKGKGGWSAQFMKGTIECLAVLKACGYGFSIGIDLAAGTKERIFDLQSSTLEPDAIFYPNAIYGNIISFHGCHYPEDEIAKIATLYYGSWVNFLLTAILSR
ncbi:MAG TPA: methyltransferase [Cyanobacteria bacterium UBA8803]|nr:methyltransferase [Cyanobacteria bacterium UBA9273]HBL62867.1 methyltransferase [Cyanobacteria bacterium UBA8803]